MKQTNSIQIAMFTNRARLCFILSLLLLLLFSHAAKAAPFDVLDYDVEITPNMTERTLSGVVSIRLASRVNNLSEVKLDAQELTVWEVTEGGSELRFEAEEGGLVIHLTRSARENETRTLRIRYSGKPVRGLKFYEDHLYAAYNTPRWLVCHFDPGDKATIRLRLTVPSDFKVVANGELVQTKALPENLVEHTWRESKSVPPFIYGFAAGRFQEVKRRAGRVWLHYLVRNNYTLAEIERIFADTSDALRFFEARAGARYPARRYTQVLASGSVMQEMSGFTVMRENYGREVLDEPRENWLIVHEFAHQWWGNSVSCAGWSDFWLNEGFAELMMSAYREQRFGRDEYDRDMELARMGYERIRAAGNDRPLASRVAVAESKAGGAIVYDKGALVLNLLRYTLGERAFWEGVRRYTSRNFGASVTTRDLKKAMEEASGRRLDDFFERWIYGSGVPDIVARHRLEKGEVVLEIEQRQSSLWTTPVQLAVETDAERQTRRVELTNQKQEVRFYIKGELRSVRVDDGGRLPFRVKHERPVSMLLYQLAHEPDTAGRADALREIQALLTSTKDESASAQLKAALKERAAQDKTRLIRTLAARALDEEKR